MMMPRPDGTGSCPSGSQPTAVHASRRDPSRKDAKIVALKRQLEEARETNRRLNRRVQEAESGALRDKTIRDFHKVKRQASWDRAWAFQSADRMSKSFDAMKEVYKMAAEVLGLPRDKFHSVMDHAFVDPTYKFMGGHPEPGIIYANVFVSERGGVFSYDIRGIVEAAIKHLRGESVSVSDERAKRENAKHSNPKGASTTDEVGDAHV